MIWWLYAVKIAWEAAEMRVSMGTLIVYGVSFKLKFISRYFSREVVVIVWRIGIQAIGFAAAFERQKMGWISHTLEHFQLRSPSSK
jgi:hypothetical protein